MNSTSLLEFSPEFFLSAAPIFLLSFFALVALLQSVSKRFSGTIGVTICHFLAIGGSLACVLFNVQSETTQQFLNGSYSQENLTLFGQISVLTIALVTSVMMFATHERQRFFHGEIVSIFLMTLVGMLTMLSANELISVFVGLEVASIGLYSLIGYINPTRQSKEGAVKYLILGSFASAFMLFGFALLYAATGSMNVSDIVDAMNISETIRPWAKLGTLFTIVGLGFKLALAPFHMWAPDAYESAPTGLTAFMATAVKVMVIVVMLRFLGRGMSGMGEVWSMFLVFVATLSILVGNIMALVQSSLKRMLAYSSVAHAGYMAIAMCAVANQTAQLAAASILFYVVVYSIVSLAAFGVIMWLENEKSTNIQIDDLAGLVEKNPWTALALATAMFAFAGIPPSGGFMGKLFLFNAALIEGYYGLVLVGIIGAVIGVYYYLRVIVKLFMSKSGPNTVAPRSLFSLPITGIVLVCLLLTLFLGTIFPNDLVSAMKVAVAPVVNKTTTTH